MIIAKFENICLEKAGQNILRDINFELKKGEITTLVGPNGGGKTSIARILIGALKPSSGKVFKDKALKIGYMPQKIELNTTIPLRVIDFLRLMNDDVDEKNLENLVEKIVKNSKVSPKDFLNKQIHNLSGGQLQKILFLRAIINNPNLLVLDEPTQYMDIGAVEEFYRAINEIRNESRCAILLISHDLLTVMQKTDFVFCVNQHICCHGEPESVNKHPEYLQLFGDADGGLTVYQHHHNHRHG